MKPKDKSFDCVQMKNSIQEELLCEYEKNKGNFESYAEFIRATAENDPEIEKFRKKIAAKRVRKKTA